MMQEVLTVIIKSSTALRNDYGMICPLPAKIDRKKVKKTE